MINSTQPISALIIDDETLSRDLVKLYLEPYPDILVIGECANGIEALNSIVSLAPDLIFLDVQMPDLNGFELLRELQPEKTPVVIFITAYDQFALKAFEVNATGYLLKPFEKARFDATVKNAIALIQQSKKPELETKLQHLLLDYEAWKASSTKTVTYLSRILIKESKKAFFIKTADILFFEASGDYVSIHTPEKTYLIHDSLQHLESSLNPEQFIRIHRSTIVSIDAIRELHPHFNGEYLVLLKNGAKLKLSRSYKENLKHIRGSE